MNHYANINSVEKPEKNYAIHTIHTSFECDKEEDSHYFSYADIWIAFRGWSSTPAASGVYLNVTIVNDSVKEVLLVKF